MNDKMNPISPVDQQIRGTNHIYGSGNRSAIKHTVADSTVSRRTGTVLQPLPQVNEPNTIQSSDKYYANPKMVAVAAPRDGSVQAQVRPGEPNVNALQTVLIEINSEDQVNERVAEAVQAISQGLASTVRLGLATSELLPAVTTRLDYAVTRAEITEEQAVRIEPGVLSQGVVEDTQLLGGIGANTVEVPAGVEVDDTAEVESMLESLSAAQQSQPVTPQEAPAEVETPATEVVEEEPVAEVEEEPVVAADDSANEASESFGFQRKDELVGEASDEPAADDDDDDSDDDSDDDDEDDSDDEDDELNPFA